MKTHPTEAELALLSAGDCGTVSRLFLNRHVRQCEECLHTVAEFARLRNKVSTAADPEISEFDWDRLATEMRANIHVGLEAGACVGAAGRAQLWNPRMAAAFASLLLLIGAGWALRVGSPLAKTAGPVVSIPPVVGPVLESTGSGLELRAGESSLTLLPREGVVADQTVSAQGVIKASYVEAGGVTRNNVYLE